MGTAEEPYVVLVIFISKSVSLPAVPSEEHVRSLICESVCLFVVKYSQFPLREYTSRERLNP